MKTPDREWIRSQYQEISDDIDEAEREVSAAEERLGELHRECPHPNRGQGELSDGMEAYPNQCPDCGHFDEKEPKDEDPTG